MEQFWCRQVFHNVMRRCAVDAVVIKRPTVLSDVAQNIGFFLDLHVDVNVPV